MDTSEPDEVAKPTFSSRCPSLRRPGEEDLPWIKTQAASLFFGGAIILNALLLIVEKEVSLQTGQDTNVLLMVVQLVLLVVFIVELVMQVSANGWGYFSLSDPGGLLDALVIAISIVEYIMLPFSRERSSLKVASVMRILRLMRVSRILRLLSRCPELSLLLCGLASSLRAVFWSFIALVILMYVGALVCAMELGRSDDNADLRKYFGSVPSSFYTHFMVVTLEGYPAVAHSAGEVSWIWYVYLVCFIIFTNIVTLNLVTGIICNNVTEFSADAKLQAKQYEEESRMFEEVLHDIFINLGFPTASDICFDKFQEIIRSQSVREAINTLDICLDIDDAQLFQLLDEDGSASLSFDEFVRSLLRLRGSKSAMHSLLVQGDIISGGKQVREQFHKATRAISIASRKHTDALKEVSVNCARHLVKLFQKAKSKAPPRDHVKEQRQKQHQKVREVVLARLAEVVPSLEQNAAEASTALHRLGEQLSESRRRVSKMKEQIRMRTQYVQTGPPVVQRATSPIYHERPCWLEAVPGQVTDCVPTLMLASRSSEEESSCRAVLFPTPSSNLRSERNFNQGLLDSFRSYPEEEQRRALDATSLHSETSSVECTTMKPQSSPCVQTEPVTARVWDAVSSSIWNSQSSMGYKSKLMLIESVKAEIEGSNRLLS